MEYECIRVGCRLRHLGGKKLTMRDLWIIIRNAPPGSELATSLDSRAAWSTTEWLLALMADNTSFLAWAKSVAAQRTGARFESQLQRPGDEPVKSSVEHRESRAAHYARLKEQQQS